jgi:hypothetical protein
LPERQFCQSASFSKAQVLPERHAVLPEAECKPPVCQWN